MQPFSNLEHYEFIRFFSEFGAGELATLLFPAALIHCYNPDYWLTLSWWNLSI